MKTRKARIVEVKKGIYTYYRPQVRFFGFLWVDVDVFVYDGSVGYLIPNRCSSKGAAASVLEEYRNFKHPLKLDVENADASDL